MNNPSLKEIAIDMGSRTPRNDFEYYAITIIADQEGKPHIDCQSRWVGFEDKECKIELREARLIDALRLINVLRDDFQEGCFVVDTLKELEIFLMLGAHAVIEKNIAEKILSDFLKPSPAVRTGFLGFRSVEDLHKTIFQKAPTKKQRMRILKRDEYRCKICGERPSNNVNITLHIHHIRPWGEHGVTDDANLITLCHTCHEGLNPHYEESLFGLLSESGKLIDLESSRKAHIEGVKRYREISFRKGYKDNP